MGANRIYHRVQRTKRQQGKSVADDELAAKREKRSKPKTDPNGSVAKGRSRVGEMERAVIEECSSITDAKPTLVVAAKNLARLIDSLSGDSKGAAVQNSTTKQLMGVMADLRGDKAKAGATGRKKSGGRLATVGNLTKVRRGA